MRANRTSWAGTSPKWCGSKKSYSTRLKKYWVCRIKKKRGETIEGLIQASKIPLEHVFKIMKILVHSGASRQTTKNTMDYVANKTIASCKISWKILFFCFKQTKLWKNHCVCLTQKKITNEQFDSICCATKQEYDA